VKKGTVKKIAVGYPDRKAGATSDSAVVALSAARLHGYFGLLKKSSKSRRRRVHSLVVFGPQRSTERH
jgi:hypothetical protein